MVVSHKKKIYFEDQIVIFPFKITSMIFNTIDTQVK